MYCVIDLETTIRNEIGRNKGSAHWSNNQVCYYGLKYMNHEPEIYDRDPVPLPSTNNILVGQNIKFDLLYMLRNEQFRDQFKEYVIWDTQLAEYLLTGQADKMMSLDKLAARYGGTLKDSRMKEYWNNGIDTPDIPREEIIPYLEQDLYNTELVFLEQVKQAQALEMMPLITSQMKALKATTVMEFNGMNFDSGKAELLSDICKEQMAILDKNFKSLVGAMNVELNISSNRHVSAVIFGGALPYSTHETVLDDDGEPVLYKSGMKKGQVKTKRVTEQEYFTRKVDPMKHIISANSNGYDVSVTVLDHLRKTEPGVKDICELVLRHRELAKQVSTYYDGFRALQYPDGYIHGELKHCNTHTGRLSSSAPNLQNLRSS